VERLYRCGAGPNPGGHSISHRVERAVYRQRINDLIHLLSDVLRIVNYREVAPAGLLSDPDDEPILATALAASAGRIVSLNTRDFPAEGEVAGVRFLTPRAFLAEVESNHPDDGLAEHVDQAGRQLP
jgi:predicted nucleic acid-binding protein